MGIGMGVKFLVDFLIDSLQSSTAFQVQNDWNPPKYKQHKFYTTNDSFVPLSKVLYYLCKANTECYYYYWSISLILSIVFGHTDMSPWEIHSSTCVLYCTLIISSPVMSTRDIFKRTILSLITKCSIVIMFWWAYKCLWVAFDYFIGPLCYALIHNLLAFGQI